MLSKTQYFISFSNSSTLCSIPAILLVCFLIATKISEYVILSESGGSGGWVVGKEVSNSAILLAIVCGISIIIGSIGCLILGIELAVNHIAYYVISRLVCSTFFGLLPCVAFFLMVILPTVILEKQEQYMGQLITYIVLLGLFFMVLIGLDMYRLVLQMKINYLSSIVFRFTFKKRYLCLVLFSLFAFGVCLVFTYWVFLLNSTIASQPVWGILDIIQMGFGFLLMEFVVNCVYSTLTHHIRNTITQEKEMFWYSSITELFHQISTNGFSILILSVFTFFHPTIYVIKDILFTISGILPFVISFFRKCFEHSYETNSNAKTVSYVTTYKLNGNEIGKSYSSHTEDGCCGCSGLFWKIFFVLTCCCTFCWVVDSLMAFFMSIILVSSSKMFMTDSTFWNGMKNRFQNFRKYSFSMESFSSFFLGHHLLGDEVSNTIVSALVRTRSSCGVICALSLHFITQYSNGHLDSSFLSTNIFILYLVGEKLCGALLIMIEVPVMVGILMIFESETPDASNGANMLWTSFLRNYVESISEMDRERVTSRSLSETQQPQAAESNL